MKERSHLQALHSPLLLETVKQDQFSVPEVSLRRAETNLVHLRVMRQALLQAKLPLLGAAGWRELLQANLLVKAKQVVLKQKDYDFVSQLAKQLLVLLR
jgi:hypothetical protein